MTPQEASRVVQLLEQAYRAQDSFEDTVRRIAEEIPHLTPKDIQQVAAVHAEEMRMEAAEYAAAAAAANQIAEIIRETERISGNSALTTETAFQILADRAGLGDKRATELLEKFGEAALVAGLGRD